MIYNRKAVHLNNNSSNIEKATPTVTPVSYVKNKLLQEMPENITGWPERVHNSNSTDMIM